MAIDVRPATVFDDVAAVVGPKKPTSNVCFCLSYRLGAEENTALRGEARAAPPTCGRCGASVCARVIADAASPTP